MKLFRAFELDLEFGPGDGDKTLAADGVGSPIPVGTMYEGRSKWRHSAAPVAG